MEVPLDLTSKKDFVWPDSDVGQSGTDAVFNTTKVKTEANMNDMVSDRNFGFAGEKVYTDLDKQDVERNGGDSGNDGKVKEETRVYIKEEVHGEDSEDDGYGGRASYGGNLQLDMCVEGEGGEDVVPDSKPSRSIAGQCGDSESGKEDDSDMNSAEFVLPDIKPHFNNSAIDKTFPALGMPMLNEGEETKVDGGTAAFLCETLMNVAPDRRSIKLSKHYAAIRANETAEAIEALKKALHREKNFACNICGNLFKDRRNLNRHVKRIHCDDKKYHCETCGKGFCFVSHLMRHAESHSAEKKHVCGTCGRGFNLTSNLERHMITHSQEKPFECCVCGARFSQNYYLQAHAVIHTGEKRFECATCGMKFGNRSNLRRHFRSHSSEKPYSCPICNQRFRFSNNISKHKKKYHKAT